VPVPTEATPSIPGAVPVNPVMPLKDMAVTTVKAADMGVTPPTVPLRGPEKPVEAVMVVPVIVVNTPVDAVVVPMGPGTVKSTPP
jgi:hypothetical protein